MDAAEEEEPEAAMSADRGSGGRMRRLVREEDFDLEMRQKQLAMQKKHAQAQEAWRHFADHLGKDDVKKFLSVR